MNILFFYIGTPTPILETELELIRMHEKSCDNVKVIQCTGNLPNCHWNQDRIISQCTVCKSKFKNGWDVLNPGKNVELNKFKNENEIAINFPKDFNSVEDVKGYKYDNESLGYGVASTLISIFRDHRFNTHKYYPEIIRNLTTAIEVYEALKSEFEQFKPDRVYIFNGRIATHLPAMLLCKRMGIEYFTYEVANKENSYKLVKNSSVHQPIPANQVNLLRSNWTSDYANIAHSYYKKKRNGDNFENVLNFISSQKKGTLPKSLNTSNKNIAIFNSTIDEYAGIEGWDTFYSPDETAGIEKIIESFAVDEYMFYLRIHPHMKGLPDCTSQLKDIHELARKFENLHVIWPEESVDTYALIDACEKVISFGSTVGVEATYWGKPSISLGQTAYKNFDCVYSPSSHEECIRLIRSDIKPVPIEGALQYAFMEINNGIQFQFFKQKDFKGGLAHGSFDGVEIKADLYVYLYNDAVQFLRRIKRLALNPSLLLKKFPPHQLGKKFYSKKGRNDK